MEDGYRYRARVLPLEVRSPATNTVMCTMDHQVIPVSRLGRFCLHLGKNSLHITGTCHCCRLLNPNFNAGSTRRAHSVRYVPTLQQKSVLAGIISQVAAIIVSSRSTTTTAFINCELDFGSGYIPV